MMLQRGLVRWNVSNLPYSSFSTTGSKESLQEGLALGKHEMTNTMAKIMNEVKRLTYPLKILVLALRVS